MKSVVSFVVLPENTDMAEFLTEEVLDPNSENRPDIFLVKKMAKENCSLKNETFKNSFSVPYKVFELVVSIKEV